MIQTSLEMVDLLIWFVVLHLIQSTTNVCPSQIRINVIVACTINQLIIRSRLKANFPHNPFIITTHLILSRETLKTSSKGKKNLNFLTHAKFQRIKHFATLQVCQNFFDCFMHSPNNLTQIVAASRIIHLLGECFRQRALKKIFACSIKAKYLFAVFLTEMLPFLGFLMTVVPIFESMVIYAPSLEYRRSPPMK